MKIKSILFFAIPFLSLLLVFSSCNNDEDEGNTSPTCTFTSPISDSEFIQGEDIEMTVLASDLDGNISSIRYYLDGLEIAELIDAPYTYTLSTNYVSLGNHNLKARATDNNGAFITKKISINIINDEPIPGPEALFTVDKTSLLLGNPCTFTDQSTNSPSSWIWDFGDGSQSTDQNPIHTYQSTGTYTIKLMIRNNVGSDTLINDNFITITENSLIYNGTTSIITSGNVSINSLDNNMRHSTIILYSEDGKELHFGDIHHIDADISGEYTISNNNTHEETLIHEAVLSYQDNFTSIDEGTLTISKNGEIYNIEFIGKDNQNIEIEVSYTGEAIVQ